MATRHRPIVWMNVTTSVRWNRPPVGIVRVERALAQELQALFEPDQFRLCVWQDERFVEWLPTPAEPPSSQVERAVETILPRSASFDLARPYVLRALRRFSGLSSGKQPGETLPVVLPTNGQERLHPAPGDFVVSVGLDWDNQYTDRFHELTKQHGLRIITCCYDLIPVLFPQYCVGEVAQRFTEYFMQLSWGSEAVLCISKQTQRDYTELCRRLGAPDRRTVVIPLGDSIPAEKRDIDVQVLTLSRRPFILFVSTIERRKNHEVLYRAYHLLARRGHAAILPKLVFVGMPGWGVGDLLKDIELDPLTKDLIVQLNHVSDGDLNHLYRHAHFCVYPSLYEGWGLPVGEALAMGKAVVASAEGSLPEVGGELVRYLPPWDAEAWATEILALVQHPERVQDMERAVRAAYRPRQWADTGRVVKTLIEELIQSSEPYRLELLPGYDMSTYSGVHAGPSVEANEVAGMLLFGPHWALPQGAHHVRIHGLVRGNTAASVLVDVVSDKGRKVHHERRYDFAPSSGGTLLASFDFALDRPVDDFEIRCVVGESASLRIDRIEISGIDASVAKGTDRGVPTVAA